MDIESACFVGDLARPVAAESLGAAVAVVVDSAVVDSAGAVDGGKCGKFGKFGRRAARRTPQSQAEFKRELLVFAKALYHELGGEALSIRTLTEAFGMSTMSFYGYFDSKQDLVKHILTDVFEELLAVLRPLDAPGHAPLPVFEAHVRAFVAYWERHPKHFRLVYLPQPGAPGDAPISYRDDPVYLAVVNLGVQRVRACLGGVHPRSADLRTLCDLLFVKVLGHLHAHIVVGRVGAGAQDRLREAVIQDIVRTVASAAD